MQKTQLHNKLYFMLHHNKFSLSFSVRVLFLFVLYVLVLKLDFFYFKLNGNTT